MDSIRKFFTFACITLLIYTFGFLFFIMDSLMFMHKNMRAVLVFRCWSGLSEFLSSVCLSVCLSWAGPGRLLISIFGPVWAGPAGTAQASPGRPKQDAFLHGMPSITPLVSLIQCNALDAQNPFFFLSSFAQRLPMQSKDFLTFTFQKT